jgi:hypothetical protein
MYLRNKSQYADDEVRSLIEFAGKPFELRYVCVNVRNTPHPFAGMAYRGVPRMSNAPRSAKYLVTLRIGAADHFTSRNVTNLRLTERWQKIDREEYTRMRDAARLNGGPLDCRVRWTLTDENIYERLISTEHIPYGGKGSPAIHYRSWQEALVAVAAHEFKHIEQFQTRKPASEIMCERAAFNALERYRASADLLVCC